MESVESASLVRAAGTRLSEYQSQPDSLSLLPPTYVCKTCVCAIVPGQSWLGRRVALTWRRPCCARRGVIDRVGRHNPGWGCGTRRGAQDMGRAVVMGREVLDIRLGVNKEGKGEQERQGGRAKRDGQSRGEEKKTLWSCSWGGRQI